MKKEKRSWVETCFQFIDKNLNLTQQSVGQRGVACVVAEAKETRWEELEPRKSL